MAGNGDPDAGWWHGRTDDRAAFGARGGSCDCGTRLRHVERHAEGHGGNGSEALAAAAVGSRQLADELGSLGGVPLTAGSQRSALTWVAYSATTEPEHEEDERTGRYRPTGRVIAWVAVSLVVRDFGLVDRLSGVLATREACNVSPPQLAGRSRQPDMARGSCCGCPGRDHHLGLRRSAVPC